MDESQHRDRRCGGDDRAWQERAGRRFADAASVTWRVRPFMGICEGRQGSLPADCARARRRLSNVFAHRMAFSVPGRSHFVDLPVVAPDALPVGYRGQRLLQVSEPRKQAHGRPVSAGIEHPTACVQSVSALGCEHTGHRARSWEIFHDRTGDG